MDVAIGDRWAPLMNTLVEQGRYASATDVVTEALSLLAERERKFQELKQSILDAIEEGGDVSDAEMDATFAAVDAQLRLRGFTD